MKRGCPSAPAFPVRWQVIPTHWLLKSPPCQSRMFGRPDADKYILYSIHVNRAGIGFTGVPRPTGFVRVVSSLPLEVKLNSTGTSTVLFFLLPPVVLPNRNLYLTSLNIKDLSYIISASSYLNFTGSKYLYNSTGSIPQIDLYHISPFSDRQTVFG